MTAATEVLSLVTFPGAANGVREFCQRLVADHMPYQLLHGCTCVVVVGCRDGKRLTAEILRHKLRLGISP